MIDDGNEMLEYSNRYFLEVLNKHARIRSMKVKYRQCPFMNHEIKELMDTRDRLHELARRTRMLVDWEGYRLSRDRVKEKLRVAEKDHFRKKSTTARKETPFGKLKGTVSPSQRSITLCLHKG